MPWAQLEDVTFRYNILRHSCAGVQQFGADGNAGSNSQQQRRVTWEHNIFYDINNNV